MKQQPPTLSSILPHLPDYLATALTIDTASSIYPWPPRHLIYSQTFELTNPDPDLLTYLLSYINTLPPISPSVMAPH